MKIFVDENIPLITVETLRQIGHNVKDIRRTDDEGISDDEIWNKTQQENRMLITTDKGFAKYRGYPHYGILIIRLKKPNCKRIHERIISTINQIPTDEWEGLLVVMRDTVQSSWRMK